MSRGKASFINLHVTHHCHVGSHIVGHVTDTWKVIHETATSPPDISGLYSYIDVASKMGKCLKSRMMRDFYELLDYTIRLDD